VRTTLNLPGQIFSWLLDWTVATHRLAVALIAVGWVLATAVIAGITRAGGVLIASAPPLSFFEGI
jgi:hypothetical protein